jgi:hypothetical protein
MPYTVEVPGRGVVEVPDDVSLEQAQKEIEKAFLKVSSLRRTPDEVPVGWWTSSDYLKSKGISQATANKHIKLT